MISPNERWLTNRVEAEMSSSVVTDHVSLGSVASGSLEEHDVNRMLVNEAAKEMYTTVDPNEPRKLVAEDIVAAEDSEIQNFQEIKKRKKFRILDLLRNDAKGFYDGRRSTSVSPSPAPFVCMFGTRLREDVDPDADAGETHPGYAEANGTIRSEGKYYMSQSRLELIGKLYKAFKRADHAYDEKPTTHAVRQTFEFDPHVHDIFNLQTKAVVPHVADAQKNTSSLEEKKGRPRVFGLQKSERMSKWEECWYNLWSQCKPDVNDIMRVMDRKLQQNVINKWWIEMKRFISTMTTVIPTTFPDEKEFVSILV